jgi:predicted kinase
MAFLFMDLVFRGRQDLAQAFAEAYFQAARDGEGWALLPFYSAYRAAVRGKVEGFELAEKEIPEPERVAALARARAHWLLALAALEEPKRKPCLVLVGGLPGTGKSTLARGLAEHANFSVIRSDVVRKELVGSDHRIQNRSAFEEEIYAPEWTARTYAECLRRTENLLFRGERALVDATFREEARRRSFLDAAARWAVPSVFFHCQAQPETIRRRLGNRSNDASDADWFVYEQIAKRWDEPSPLTRQAMREISTGGTLEQAVSEALADLRELHLCD